MTLRTVLVVTTDASLRASLVSALGARGFKVLTAETFAEGRKLLIDWQPHVLVTSIRLREHNGLHLAIVSRQTSVLTKTIVIGYADPVLQAEARQAGALYLSDPTADTVVAAVENAIQRRERRWPRSRTNITARAADQIVQLVDVSYGGFRMELPAGAALSSSERFDLMVGSLQIAALPVWMKEQSINERLWCGATVADDGEINLAWRAFVDDTLSHAVQ
jgi:ActR/RegA family two-component response regulator